MELACGQNSSSGSEWINSRGKKASLSATCRSGGLAATTIFLTPATSTTLGRLQFLAYSRQIPALSGRGPNPGAATGEGRRKKEEGRRKKEEGRRKKEEGRRKMWKCSHNISYSRLSPYQADPGNADPQALPRNAQK